LEFLQRLISDAKNLIMDSLFRLKSIDAKFKGITVSHDMTKNERDDCKKLVDEDKQKENQDASGEWIYRIRYQPPIPRSPLFRGSAIPRVYNLPRIGCKGRLKGCTGQAYGYLDLNIFLGVK